MEVGQDGRLRKLEDAMLLEEGGLAGHRRSLAVIASRWERLRPEMEKRWGHLDAMDLEEIHRDPELLIAKLQEKYNATREQAENEVDRFLEAVSKE